MGRGQYSGGRSLRDRVPEIDRTTLAIILSGVTLVVAIVFPRIYPAARRGPECSNLAPPLGGNNRSVLAYESHNPNALSLDLTLAQSTFTVNEALDIRLTFVNKDNAPIILHLNPEGPILTANDAVQGVTFEITRVGGGAVADQPETYQPPTTFSNPEELHLLGSRARCNESYGFSPTELTAIGVGAGEYRIRAFYRNSSPGDPRPIQPANATATPIPEYADSQGVWVGSASSQEVRFSIVTPGP